MVGMGFADDLNDFSFGFMVDFGRKIFRAFGRDFDAFESVEGARNNIPGLAGSLDSDV